MEMENADYPFTDANKALLATAYEGNPPKPGAYPLIYLRPAGDLKASPGELAKVVQFFLRRGKAGGAQQVKTQTILSTGDPENPLARLNRVVPRSLPLYHWSGDGGVGRNHPAAAIVVRV